MKSLLMVLAVVAVMGLGAASAEAGCRSGGYGSYGGRSVHVSRHSHSHGHSYRRVHSHGGIVVYPAFSYHGNHWGAHYGYGGLSFHFGH